MPRGGKGGIHTDTGIFSKQIDEFDDWLGLASSDTSLTSRKEIKNALFSFLHGLRTPREEISFTARPKIQSQSQIFRYGGSIFCLPHRPNFSDIFDLCLHWVSVVRAMNLASNVLRFKNLISWTPHKHKMKQNSFVSKPKLLSAEVKNSQIILRIENSKSALQIWLFWRDFVRIGKTIRRITWLFFTLTLSSARSLVTLFR